MYTDALGCRFGFLCAGSMQCYPGACTTSSWWADKLCDNVSLHTKAENRKRMEGVGADGLCTVPT
eukprot:1825324-Amphidinium_carterae.1